MNSYYLIYDFDKTSLMRMMRVRSDVSNKKPGDNLHPLSRFLFLTVNYDTKLGGDFGKY